jgi:hypothetical protein
VTSRQPRPGLSVRVRLVGPLAAILSSTPAPASYAVTGSIRLTRGIVERVSSAPAEPDAEQRDDGANGLRPGVRVHKEALRGRLPPLMAGRPSFLPRVWPSC